MSLESADKECAAVAVAPRVSLEDIKRKIESEYHTTAYDAFPQYYDRPEALKLLSICVLVLKNGFTIIGKSAPASAANFNADLGRKLAYEDAIRQIWPFLGFQLRQKLYDAGA